MEVAVDSQPPKPKPLVTVRALTVDDLFDLVALASELIPDQAGLEELLGLGAEAAGKDDAERGRVVVREVRRILPKLSGEHRARVVGFLAGLCDIAPEDYRKLPPSALPQTVRQATNRPEFPDFFAEFQQLWVGGDTGG